MGSIYDNLVGRLTALGVSGSDMPATLHDILAIITDESGGNPYAVNDNTTHKSYSFKTKEEATAYVTSHSHDTMAIGLFQLLTPGGMGGVMKQAPEMLLDPNLNMQIALPKLVDQQSVARQYPAGTTQRFNAAVGTAWAADLPKFGGPGMPSDSKIQATIARLNGGQAPATTGASVSVQAPQTPATITNTLDFVKQLFSLNSLIMIVALFGVVAILVGMAKIQPKE